MHLVRTVLLKQGQRVTVVDNNEERKEETGPKVLHIATDEYVSVSFSTSMQYIFNCYSRLWLQISTSPPKTLHLNLNLGGKSSPNITFHSQTTNIHNRNSILDLIFLLPQPVLLFSIILRVLIRSTSPSPSQYLTVSKTILSIPNQIIAFRYQRIPPKMKIRILSAAAPPHI